MTWRSYFLPAILAVALLCLVPLVSAEDIRGVLQEIEQNNAEIEELNGKINWTLIYKNDLVGQIRDLDLLIYLGQMELDRLQGNLVRLEEEIDSASERLTNTERDLNEIDALVKERLRVLYKNSNLSYLEVLFQSTSYSDFLQRFEMVRRIIESDVALLNNLQFMRQELNSLKRQLEDDQAEQQRLQQRELYTTLNLEDQQEDKNKLVDGLDSQLSSYLAAKQELEAKSTELEETLRIMQEANRNRALGSGIYRWPLDEGYWSVSSEFGWRPDPFGGNYSNNHQGMDIEAPHGADILAVDAGIVLVSEYGYNGGYGNMVILDHGQGIAT
ncbi:MAG: peptidoglycan DD-metalloendopeptidase family protein, partial [Symbiobacteriaceae bacterium]|nr:peptidoglycan DD-metalloendopeptidase family protein [Symbiobacteriaceae bacterium]